MPVLCCISVCHCSDDDMMSIASMMSISNLSTIGFLEDEEDDDFSFMYVRQTPHVYKTNRFLQDTSAKSLCGPHVPQPK